MPPVPIPRLAVERSGDEPALDAGIAQRHVGTLILAGRGLVRARRPAREDGRRFRRLLPDDLGALCVPQGADPLQVWARKEVLDRGIERTGPWPSRGGLISSHFPVSHAKLQPPHPHLRHDGVPGGAQHARLALQGLLRGPGGLGRWQFWCFNIARWGWGCSCSCLNRASQEEPCALAHQCPAHFTSNSKSCLHQTYRQAISSTPWARKTRQCWSLRPWLAVQPPVAACTAISARE